MSRAKFVKENANKVVYLAQQGLNAAAIAERFSCGRNTVALVLRNNGWEWDSSTLAWRDPHKSLSSSPNSGTK